MSLRINGKPRLATDAQSSDQDGWPSRLAKLIPAEALGLYGSGQSVIPATSHYGTWILGAVCLLLSGVIRYLATRDANGNPQWVAIGIAIVSFILWVLALKPPAGPVDLGAHAYYATLATIIWASVLPIFYKG